MDWKHHKKQQDSIFCSPKTVSVKNCFENKVAEHHGPGRQCPGKLVPYNRILSFQWSRHSIHTVKGEGNLATVPVGNRHWNHSHRSGFRCMKNGGVVGTRRISLKFQKAWEANVPLKKKCMSYKCEDKDAMDMPEVWRSWEQGSSEENCDSAAVLSHRDAMEITITGSAIGIGPHKPFTVHVLVQMALDAAHGITGFIVCLARFWTCSDLIALLLPCL